MLCCVDDGSKDESAATKVLTICSGKMGKGNGSVVWKYSDILCDVVSDTETVISSRGFVFEVERPT